MRKRKTDTNEVLEMHQAGKTLTEIAEHFRCSVPNICRMLKRLAPPPPMPESFTDLTEKEQQFVLARVSGKTQTESALQSHDCQDRVSAKSIGWQLSNKPEIEKAIQDILQEEGLTKRYRIKKLKGHVDHKNPDVSLKALDMTWRLDGAYIEKHVVMTVPYGELVMDLESNRREREQLEKELGIIDMTPGERDRYVMGMVSKAG